MERVLLSAGSIIATVVFKAGSVDSKIVSELATQIDSQPSVFSVPGYTTTGGATIEPKTPMGSPMTPPNEEPITPIRQPKPNKNTEKVKPKFRPVSPIPAPVPTTAVSTALASTPEPEPPAPLEHELAPVVLPAMQEQLAAFDEMDQTGHGVLSLAEINQAVRTGPCRPRPALQS